MRQQAVALTEKGPPERLQALILRRLRELGTHAGPMSALEAVKRAGEPISYESVRYLARGQGRGKITDRTAEGLAKILEIPVAEVYAAAGIPTPGQRWKMPERFDRLTDYQRGLLEGVAAALLEAYDKGRQDEREAGERNVNL
jgi:hypothetical protein